MIHATTRPAIIVGLLAVSTALPGCFSHQDNVAPPGDYSHFQAMATQVEYPTEPAP